MGRHLIVILTVFYVISVTIGNGEKLKKRDLISLRIVYSVLGQRTGFERYRPPSEDNRERECDCSALERRIEWYQSNHRRHDSGSDNELGLELVTVDPSNDPEILRGNRAIFLARQSMNRGEMLISRGYDEEYCTRAIQLKDCKNMKPLVS